MPDALALQLTNAGLAAVQATAGTSATVISKLGLTDTVFVAAPTLTALPGEFKQLDIAGGAAASDTVIHLTAYDQSDEVWNATGFGLYLDDGTLFATYSAEDTVLSKAGLAFALLVADITLAADLVEDITFGDATFVWPPATETTRGIARLATQEEVDEGEDDETIVTPLTFATRLAAALSALSDAFTTSLAALTATVAALTARTITGAGLISGGGDLSDNRELTVTEATEAEITAGTSATTVVTPRRLGPISMQLAQNGYIVFFGLQICWGRVSAAANSNTAVIFARAFDTACFAAICSGAGTSTGAQDNWPATDSSTISQTGFEVTSAASAAITTCYIALGN